MSRVAAGDVAALSEIYEQFSAQVYGLARRVTRDDALAEEVTQEVFCQVWERPDRFECQRGAIRTFLCTLAHRRAVDCVRVAEARRRRDTTHVPDITHFDRSDMVEDIASREIADAVRTAVQSLPEVERHPVMMAYFGGYTYCKVASALGIPEGTVKTRIRRALEKLSKTLTEQGITIRW